MAKISKKATKDAEEIGSSKMGKDVQYGTQLINRLAKELQRNYQKGYSPRDLRSYRQFYLCFKDLEKWHSRVPNLTWTHFRTLLRVTSDDARVAAGD